MMANEQAGKGKEVIQWYRRTRAVDGYQSISGPELLRPIHFHYASTTTNTSRAPVVNKNHFVSTTPSNYPRNGNSYNTNTEQKLQRHGEKRKRVSNNNTNDLHSAIFAFGLHSEHVLEKIMEKENLRCLPNIHFYLDRYRNTYSGIQQMSKGPGIQNKTKNKHILNEGGGLLTRNSAVGGKVSNSKDISSSPLTRTSLSESMTHNAMNTTNTSYPSAEQQQTSALVSIDSTVEEETDVFIMPQLAESEKKTSIGASLAFLMGLYFTLLDELKENRKDNSNTEDVICTNAASDRMIPEAFVHIQHNHHFLVDDQELQTVSSTRKDSIDSIDVSLWGNSLTDERRDCYSESYENIPSYSIQVSSASVFQNKDVENRSRMQNEKGNGKSRCNSFTKAFDNEDTTESSWSCSQCEYQLPNCSSNMGGGPRSTHHATSSFEDIQEKERNYSILGDMKDILFDDYIERGIDSTHSSALSLASHLCLERNCT